MVTVIPKRVENIWEVWNVRGAIISSFLVQVFLVLFAPLRKRSDNLLLQFFIWSAYLLADWAANFTMGLITNNINRGGGDDDNDAAKQVILMALWAPFVLVHFGGPDTITAFSLEDNQLWLRQIPSLLFQVGASGYVIVLSLPQNPLWLPTFLVFVAGIIKCFERTRSLYLASNTTSLGTRINSSAFQSLEGGPSKVEESDLPDELCQRLSSLYPFQPNVNRGKLEYIHEFMYERYYTKGPVLRSKVGYFLRFVAFISMVVALGVFSIIDKKTKLDKVDVTITYTLFCGALFLELISLLMRAMTSTYFRLLLKKRHYVGQPYPICFRPWSHSISGHNLIRLYLSKCHHPNKFLLLEGTFITQIAEYLGVKQLLELSKYKTKTPFLRGDDLWGYISYGLYLSRKAKLRPESTLKQRITMHSQDAGGRIEDAIENTMNHIIYPFMNSDHDYPFGRTLILLHIATTLCYADEDDDNNYSGEDALPRFRTSDFRRFSKVISDYMMYLFLMQPDMLSEVPGVEEAWIQETMAVESVSSEFIEFFKKNGLTSRDHDEKEASRSVLSSLDCYYNSSSSPPYPTVLLLARSIAQDLKELAPSLKWEAMASIWVQILIFAATHCRTSIHIQHIPKGGELISIVWLAVLYWDSLERITGGLSFSHS